MCTANVGGGAAAKRFRARLTVQVDQPRKRYARMLAGYGRIAGESVAGGEYGSECRRNIARATAKRGAVALYL